MSTNIAKQKETSIPSLLSDFFGADRLFTAPWLENRLRETVPAVNIRDTASAFEIEFAAPGFSKDDFTVEVHNSTLSVSAERKTEKNEEKENYTRREFSYDSFSRSFNLPESANGDNIQAKYTDGLLKLSIPKKNAESQSGKKQVKVS